MARACAVGTVKKIKIQRKGAFQHELRRWDICNMSTRCNTLQDTATRCITLQHTA